MQEVLYPAMCCPLRDVVPGKTVEVVEFFGGNERIAVGTIVSVTDRSASGLRPLVEYTRDLDAYGDKATRAKTYTCDMTHVIDAW